MCTWKDTSDWEQALGRQQFGPWLTGSADALSEKVAKRRWGTPLEFAKLGRCRSRRKRRVRHPFVHRSSPMVVPMSVPAPACLGSQRGVSHDAEIFVAPPSGAWTARRRR